MRVDTRKRERVWHAVKGDPCPCGKPASSHPSSERLAKRRAYDKPRVARDTRSFVAPLVKAVRDVGRERRGEDLEKCIVGIDGEGEDDENGKHRYTYMAAVTEFGKCVAEVYNSKGLTHEECMGFLLRIPPSLKFAFSFGYDITMFLGEMPDSVKYRLLRPDTRTRRYCKDCKKAWNSLLAKQCLWCKSENTTTNRPFLQWNGKGYDYFNNAFTVAIDYDRVKRKWRKSSHVWDCFRFFGTSFVESLHDWGIGTKEQRALIAEMKAKRGTFSEEKEEDKQYYCKLECQLLAQMMRKVIDSHDAAELHLERYDGAGSTASAMLKRFGVEEFKGPHISELPDELMRAIMAAFFGGRFENSVVGEIYEPVYGRDISSAYPYAQTFLPCFACGKWSKTGRNVRTIEGAHAAVCRFKVAPMSEADRAEMAWMPLPFRDEKGSICYPTGFEGWAWWSELKPALTGWPHLVKLQEAWVYHTDCAHRPFDYVPSVYRKRIEWGKEGAGKALKLGVNAGYGKTAQSKGDRPKYQQWAWAGMTTASTRGQATSAILAAEDPWNVLAIATDGLYARERLDLPEPVETGTGSVTVLMGEDAGKVKEKPLGGWEHNDPIDDGAFFVKPGMYFRIHEKDLKKIRARGVGRREVLEQKEALIEGFRSWDRKNFEHCVEILGRRFYGAKHCIFAMSSCVTCSTSWPGVPERKCPKCRLIGNGGMRIGQLKTPDGETAYGQWRERISKIAFDPRPKREACLDMGGTSSRLRIRDVGGQVSMPYKIGRTTPEGEAMREVREFMLEQPDWDDGKEWAEE